jgi:hypothetical protein
MALIHQFAFLAQQTTPSADGIEWRWFILGCVLILVAIIAFFWGFALGELKHGQYMLLMWILPLSSGFAAGSFAGSIKATGPIGQIAITATGGFAVWLLSFLLIPKPPKTEPPPPPSDSVDLSDGLSLRQAVDVILQPDGHSAVFKGFDDAILNAKIRQGRVTAGGPRQLIERLQHRFVDGTIAARFGVTFDQNRGVYEITRL